MSVPVWVREASEQFWRWAGDPPPFPRDLTAAVHTALPVSVVPRPGLTYRSAVELLATWNVPAACDTDRALRGLLYCRRGGGFILVDADDPADERRFTVAHELAHFLRDHLLPRRAAERALGPDIRAVLDGRRHPTRDERLHAVLRRVPIGPHVHLMGRDDLGRPDRPEARDAEQRADRLACELLAPVDLLARETDTDALAEQLVSAFGLPAAVARRYALTLLPPPTPVGPLVARLREFS